ncbi:hypothetical protein DPEC_G00303260 [Dallia pectoralis]|uniref:Uncharacterized protein n=1 Tax=Dallia pectoralis TaxID=75939 RepID=A0ACC2FD76_DALPE|nr:hypothetical protein DPEC_G00303260 [Dallia pectoralis]
MFPGAIPSSHTENDFMEWRNGPQMDPGQCLTRGQSTVHNENDLMEWSHGSQKDPVQHLTMEIPMEVE